jgi:hypothetical protein
MSAAEIAAGLTKAQKRWITGRGAGAKCTKRLQELGLIKPYDNKSWMLLSLGIEVRNHLTKGTSDEVE